MRPQRLTTLLLMTAALANGAEFWSARTPQQWSKNEIRRMVTDSPWAKAAEVDWKTGPGAMFESPDNLPADTPGTRSSNGPAAVQHQASRPASPKVIVRWDSAAPVCDACARGGLEKYLFTCTSKLLYVSGLSEKFAEMAQSFYIISLSNYPKIVPAGSGHEPPQHSPAAQAALERIGQRMQEMTWLRIKGREPIRPARVLILPAGTGLLPVIFFPRTELLTGDDPDLVFESGDGTLSLTVEFSLGKMVYHGKLAL
jgi:hypothetical protein